MTTELKPFTRADFNALIQQKDVDSKYIAEHTERITTDVYNDILKRIKNQDVLRNPENYIISNYSSRNNRRVNYLVTEKIRDLFPDFTVEGVYTAELESSDGIRPPWFNYAIKVYMS
jgi:hypothetical protein